MNRQINAVNQVLLSHHFECRNIERASSLRAQISSLKARNAKLRSEKANERMKRQLSAVDQVLQPEDAAGARLVEGPGFGKDHRLALVRGNDAWGELRPFRTWLFEEEEMVIDGLKICARSRDDIELHTCQLETRVPGESCVRSQLGLSKKYW